MGANLACMLVRTATLDDMAMVSAILAASYPSLMRGAYPEDLLARALPRITSANPALLASGTYYLAEAADGTAAGCGGWSYRPPEEDRREQGVAHIRHFATRDGWTGKGVGRAIFHRCEADARAAGFSQFTCYSSLNGECFYAALGFRRIREIAVPLRRDLSFPSILMVRGIAP